MISGSEVDRLITEFRNAADTAYEHRDHGCPGAVFAAGYAAALAGALQALGVEESDVYPDAPGDVTVTVEPMVPPLTVADIDATNTDELISALISQENGR